LVKKTDCCAFSFCTQAGAWLVLDGRIRRSFFALQRIPFDSWPGEGIVACRPHRAFVRRMIP
jgi:hypothetical protein